MHNVSPVVLGDRREYSTKSDTEFVVDNIQRRMVRAAFTLRQLPDREAGLLRCKTGWPEVRHERQGYADSESLLTVMKRAPMTSEAIDDMLPTLDLLRLLPDQTDRQIVFWAAHHQNGITGNKIPWAKVKRSLDIELSRWTLKRRYENGLDWLAQIAMINA